MILESAVALLLFLLMFVVGANIELADVTRLKKQPKTILFITLGQLICLPMLAWLLIVIFEPAAIVRSGLLLVAICPGGALSNLYTLIARGNAALSVTLTSVNSLIAIVMLPLLTLSVLPIMFNLETNGTTLAIHQAKHLVISLFLPVATGISCRYLFAKVIKSFLPILEKLAAVGLLGLLAMIFIQFKPQIWSQFYDLFFLAAAFSLISLLFAWLLSQALSLKIQEQTAVLFEYPIRNLALAALLAITVFDKQEYLLFAAVFFVVQLPILFGVILYSRYQLPRMKH